jgi:hypothetical protein
MSKVENDALSVIGGCTDNFLGILNRFQLTADAEYGQFVGNATYSDADCPSSSRPAPDSHII